MKKVLVLGVGAQGSTVAKRLDNEPNVSTVVCADFDKRAVDELVKGLKKGVGVQIDATKVDSIAKAAEGMDLMVNALPVTLTKNALDAAIEAKINYQDFAAGFLTGREDETCLEYIEGIKYMYTEYSKRFKDIGKMAIIGTGSAPGFICVAARKAVSFLDSCDTVNVMVYEGVEAKRFMPFWWSPVTALGDMSGDAIAYENDKMVITEGFSRPYKRVFKEMPDKEVTLVEHWHDEPVLMGFNSNEYFKGAHNVYFKYGGVGIDFAYPLKRAGLLSKKKEQVTGCNIAPFDVILAHIPPAPKYHDEIQEIIDEGLVADTGAAVVECIGKKDGKGVMAEAHINAPGLVDSFEKFGVTAEQYLTGQGGFLFTKLFVNDKFTQQGLISSDMLTEEDRIIS